MARPLAERAKLRFAPAMGTLERDRRQTLALLGAGVALAAAGRARAAARDPQALSLPEVEFKPQTPDVVTTMDDEFRRLTVPVYVNGQGPFAFVVDTGANRSLISAGVAEALKLPQGREVTLHSIEGGQSAQTARVASFKVGAREARGIELAVVSDGGLAADGLLGVDGLKDQRLVLGFANKQLLIEPSRVTASAGKTSVMKARKRFGQLTVVDTDLGGHKVNVFIDTGSDVTVGNTVLRDRLEKRRRPGQEIKSTRLLGAAGGSVMGDYGSLPEFRLGELRLYDMRLVYADLHPFKLWNLDREPSLQLGIEIMRFFDRVTLDFGRNQVAFTLPEQAYIDPAGTTWMSPHT
jgi:predicted aspartyl protease